MTYAAPPVDADAGPSTRLSPDEVVATVRRYLDAARNYCQQTLQPFREQATEYYLGKPFGNETQGRSQFVMTELRDTVQAMLPSLMRVFFSSERVVEFRPRDANDVPYAEQASDYINYLVTEENDGFLTIYAAFKDAMVRKLGIVKFWWEPRSPVLEEYLLHGVGPEQLQTLYADPDLEQVAPLDQGADGLAIVHVVRRQSAAGRVRLAAVPPEELVFSATARTLEDALLVAHITKQRPDELRAMGYPEDLIARAIPAPPASPEEVARQLEGITAPDGADDRVEYSECYVYLDEDGDGLAEHRRICLIGDQVAHDEPFTGRPFALFACDPEPHTMVGLCTADQTMDLQRAKSAIVRGTFDSLAQTVNPDTWIVKGQVDIADVMQNAEIGRVIRVGAPGMMGEFTHEFVGPAAIPMLGVLDEVKENRTGQSKAAMGLNPDALQSSTRAAVAATVSASEQHLELTARLFAEGMKALFKGLLRLVTQYQDRPAFVRLRNTYVPVDPRPWNAGMDATVNVALGSGLTEERLQTLSLIAQKQEQILQMLGPGNPLVTLGQYRTTLATMVELAGFKDATKFFNPLPPDYQPPPQPQPPSPDMLYADVEKMKVQASMAETTQKLQLDRAKALLDAETTRDRDAQDAYLRAMELELKYNTEVDKARVAELAAEQHTPEPTSAP